LHLVDGIRLEDYGDWIVVEVRLKTN
jgi:hypothetical protein